MSRILILKISEINKIDMANIKINLLMNKGKYTSDLGDRNCRIFTTGEVITEQKDFMR
jgi:hypothetical protein